ncbi:hypothetical protein [Rodentibacter myodis]|uniref:Penicillin-binding protein activator LpoB n=1 Tax=Rodentibacter myodis TaxID=1907939 RepID=A0A1V3JTJ2_9PAST|nr:hypothetical protein [Rodentibacter myodis]OOF59751.1 hypothetical protein BKL49_02895 [Rodentibacter myodis]
MKRVFLISLAALSLSGCAELTAINNKIGEFAGELNKTLGVSATQSIEDEAVSKRDIDTLYVRLKREFNFPTKDEYLGRAYGDVRKWKIQQMEQDGIVHETNPGVYYRMARAFGNKSQYYLDISLEKDGKNSKVYWKVRGTPDVAAEVKKDILKAIK